MVWYGMVWYDMVWYGMLDVCGGAPGCRILRRSRACHTPPTPRSPQLFLAFVEYSIQVIAVNQDSLGVQAKLHTKQASASVYVIPLPFYFSNWRQRS